MRFHSSNITVGNLTFEADQSEFPVSVSKILEFSLFRCACMQKYSVLQVRCKVRMSVERIW